jgi:predicted anti-sigma-YlaC factor YlaD
MDCSLIRPDLVAYHFGSVEEPSRGAVEAHLVECRECLTVYLALKREIETARASPAPSQAARERLRRAVARETARCPGMSAAPGRWRRPLAFIFAAAASAAALLAVVSVRAQLQQMAQIAAESAARVERHPPARH